MVGLALEGGGAKGAYQAGAYMALKKCHIKIDAVAGTSIGAFNGALIASHEEDKMINLWKDATMSSLLGIDDDKAKEILDGNINFDTIKWSVKEIYKALKNGGLDISNYRALIRNNVDENALRNSDIKYGLTTVRVNDFELEEIYIEDMPEGTLHDYIVASSYLPVFKREKLVNGNTYLDGGFYNLCPTDMLENIGCDKIYSINIKGVGHKKKGKKLQTEIIEIKPFNSLGSIILFDKETNERNITYGYRDTLKVLGKIDGVHYYFKKKSDKFYKRINRKVRAASVKEVKSLLRADDYKELVLKALDYVLEKEKKDDISIYKIKDVIKLARHKKDKNAIYLYVSKLKTW